MNPVIIGNATLYLGDFFGEGAHAAHNLPAEGRSD